MASEQSKPENSSSGSSSKRSSLIHAHARVRSLDLTVTGAENRPSFVASHSRVRSLDAGQFRSLIKEDNLQTQASPIVEASTQTIESTLLGLNMDMLSTTFLYLTKEEILALCISSSRNCPQLWIAASGELARQYAQRAEACKEVAILTEIASQGQAVIHEEVCRANEGLALMLNDTRRYQRNAVRFDLEFKEAIDQEKNLAIKFQACVGILQDVMQRWTTVCKARDEIAIFSQKFHERVRVIWITAAGSVCAPDVML